MMPCYSRIKITGMMDAAQIVEAADARGASVSTQGDVITASWENGARLTFRKTGQGYQATAHGNTREQGQRSVDALKAVQRKYSELGVRKWAKKNRYSVRQKGRQLTLTRY